MDECGELQHVTVFFDRSNFLLTKYDVLTAWVHMVMVCEHMEIQIESVSCGYGGAGPNASVSLLKLFGLQEDYIEPLIFGNRALSMNVCEGKIHHISTFQLFCEDIPICSYRAEEMVNKIVCDRNVEVLLDEKKVRFYNPQRTHWRGFLNLLSYMDHIRMEYYIGEENILDEGLYVEGSFGNPLRMKYNAPDIAGTVHCNLYLQGDNFSVSCLIDQNDEVAVIHAVYLALTGKKLPMQATSPKKFGIMGLFHLKQDTDIYDCINIDDVKERE